MSTPLPKDVPPARRQPTEISLGEIESLHLQPRPQKKSGIKWLALLLIAGCGGVGLWQWARLQPRSNGARTVRSEADFRSSEGIRSSEREDVSQATADRTGRETSQVEALPKLPRNVVDSVSVPDINGDPVAAGSDADEVAAALKPDELLNHRRYEVAAPESLVPLDASSDIKLQPEVRDTITEMIARAKADGVELGVISGFRTLADQDHLYFDLKAERGESAQTRAEVSAPPGYSEHHTGYAVDFIDERKVDTHLDKSFETTAAFRWLKKNAAYFNFEMSFPKDNPANVSYEPWHWRYVGNQESLELFYK